MKKKIGIGIIVFLIIVLIILAIIYKANYKSSDEIIELMKNGTSLSNVYAERYTDNGSFDGNNIKVYKAIIYWKDNILVYDVQGTISYIDFNNNEHYMTYNDQFVKYDDISSIQKFNDYSQYFNSEDYTYKYIFPCIYNNEVCDIIQLSDENITDYWIISQETGLLMKTVTKHKTEDIDDSVQIYEYQFDVVTDEDITFYEIENYSE